MRVTQYARRSSVAAALSLALAACGKDTGPSTSIPRARRADMAVAQDAFAREPTSSLAAVGIDISAVLNGSAVVASPPALALHGPSAASAALRAEARQPCCPAGGTVPSQASVAAVPAAVLGTTFVWDETPATWPRTWPARPPTASGSCSTRWIRCSSRRSCPLVEVGYVDILDQSSGSTIDFRREGGRGERHLPRLHVTASAHGLGRPGDASAASPRTAPPWPISASRTRQRRTRAGWCSRSTTTSTSRRAACQPQLDRHVRQHLGHPGGGDARSGDQRGPTANVRLVGTYGANGGTFTVKVNGDLFATDHADRRAARSITGAQRRAADAGGGGDAAARS